MLHALPSFIWTSPRWINVCTTNKEAFPTGRPLCFIYQVITITRSIYQGFSLLPMLRPSLMERAASSSSIMIREKKLLPSSGYCTLSSAEWPKAPIKKQSRVQMGVFPPWVHGDSAGTVGRPPARGQSAGRRRKARPGWSARPERRRHRYQSAWPWRAFFWDHKLFRHVVLHPVVMGEVHGASGFVPRRPWRSSAVG